MKRIVDLTKVEDSLDQINKASSKAINSVEVYDVMSSVELDADEEFELKCSDPNVCGTYKATKFYGDYEHSEHNLCKCDSCDLVKDGRANKYCLAIKCDISDDREVYLQKIK
jgi:hypothetical protein